MRYNLFLLFFIIGLEQVFSQTSIDEIIEIYSESSQDIDIDFFVDELYTLHENPININSTNLDNLLILPFFTINDIVNIKAYIDLNGFLNSLNELLLINGFTREKITALSIFVYVSPPSLSFFPLDSSLLIKSHSELLLRVQKNISDSNDSKYIGNMCKYYSRYQYKYEDKISFGFTTEKDAGEPFFNGVNNYGFDFYSAYLQLNYLNNLYQVNIGDYSVLWGQGLVAGSSFGNFKSSNTINLGLGARTLGKYSSTDENIFFRGIALKYKPILHLEFIPLYSEKKVDAKINYEGIESLNISGLHRTESELLLKDKASERMMGLRTVWNDMYYQICINYLHYSINPKILESKYIWKKNEFMGSENENISIDYKFTLGRYYFFGESAISKNGGKAHLVGTNYMSENNLQLSVLFRSYDKDYQSIYGSGFGESRNTQNEKGIYIGLEYFPINKLRLNAYYDYFSFAQQAYRMINGGNGNEYLINLDYTLSKAVNIVFRFKAEEMPLDKTIDGFTSAINIYKNSYRLSLVNTLSDRFSLSTRINYINFKHGDLTEDGMQVNLDLKFVSLMNNFKLQTSLAFFNTDSYNTRIYTYENDVPYVFSLPFCYYKGMRAYVNTSYNIGRMISLYIKAGLSYNKVSSNKQDFKCQLRIRI